MFYVHIFLFIAVVSHNGKELTFVTEFIYNFFSIIKAFLSPHFVLYLCCTYMFSEAKVTGLS